MLAVVVAAGVALAVRRSSDAAVPPAVETAQLARVSTERAAFPLKVGPTGRYLVDRNGRPFLIVGDSPQALIADLSTSQAAGFLADREAAGFNSMWINLLCDTYTGGRADGTTYDGIAPFTTPGDLATPNPAYFARASAMIRLAGQHRIEVFLDPIETGGWLTVLRDNGTAKAYAYGRYLGARFRHFKNILWLNGNDFQSWTNTHDDALALAVARGIRSTDPSALQTVELNYQVSSSLDDPRWRGIINLDAAYTYAPTYAEVLKAQRNTAHIPAFMLEASYEGEHAYTGPETLRRQEYWTMLSGASGQFYGNKYTWQFLSGWPSNLDTVGSRQMTFVSRLFSDRAWYRLVPDSRHRLVVSGYGAYADGGDPNGSDYVTAARTTDGMLAIAYLPDGGTISVDMARLAGPRVRAQWYDPTDGRYRMVPGSPFKPRGARAFAAPARNGEGDPDWLLVLTAQQRLRTRAGSGN